jgi:hypothetical protein
MECVACGIYYTQISINNKLSDRKKAKANASYLAICCTLKTSLHNCELYIFGEIADWVVKLLVLLELERKERVKSRG